MTRPTKTPSPLTLYSRGDRTPEVVAARSVWKEKNRAHHARYGDVLVDAAPTRQAILDMHRQPGWSYVRISHMAGLSRATTGNIVRRNKWVDRKTALAVQQLWSDVCGHVDADTGRWPTAPLMEALVARYGHLGDCPDPNMVRHLYRVDTISTAQADRYATKHLSGGPESVWGYQWFGLEATA